MYFKPTVCILLRFANGLINGSISRLVILVVVSSTHLGGKSQYTSVTDRDTH